MVAIYVRQSVLKEDSISINTQVSDCKKLLAGSEKAEVFSDEGFSGKNTARPGYQKMMELVRAGKVEKVIVWKLDRLSRSILDFANFITELKKCGAKFQSVKESSLQISGNPADELMLNILSAFAQFERETIALRVKSVYYERARQGFYLGGQAPFGYTKIESTLNGKKNYEYSIDEERAKTVRWIYETYDRPGVALGHIQKELNAKGIKTTRGNFWTNSALTRVLHSPAYVKANADVYTFFQTKKVNINNPVEDYIGENGIYLYADTRSKTRSKFIDIEGSYVTIAPHPGIIEPDLWLRVQKKLEGNQMLKNSGKGQWSWLSGISKCGYCGKASVFVHNGSRTGHEHIYVSCTGRNDKYCYGRKKAIESFVVEDIVESELLKYISSLKVRRVRQADASSDKVNSLKIEIAQLDGEITSWVDRIPTASPAVMTIINQKVDELGSKKLALQTQITDINATAALPAYGGLSLDDVAKEFHSYDIDTKKLIAKVFIKQVTIKDDAIDVAFL